MKPKMLGDGLDYLRELRTDGYDDAADERGNPDKCMLTLRIWAKQAPPQGTYARMLVAIHDTIAAQAAEIERLYNACVVTEHEVQQILGEALGYPWFKDDRKNFPDATADEHGVCVGDHVAATLAVEAANRIEALKALVGEMAKDNGQVAYEGDRCNFCGEHEPDHTPDCPITRGQELGVLPKE